MESRVASGLALLGCALQYPQQGFPSTLVELEATLGAWNRRAAEAVRSFLEATSGYSHAIRCELYTRTFDLSPQCAPYLSVHLFGEEDGRRAKLMIGLLEAYGQAGLARERELPDHLAVVLRALGALQPEERDELASLCLAPALQSMTRQLRAVSNPYQFLLQGASELLGALDRVDSSEACHA